MIEHFDSPLIVRMRSSRDRGLRYFGLPGEEATDIRAWHSSIAAVAAVERSWSKLATIEATLQLEFPEIHCLVHFDEVDQVILENKGKLREIGGQPHQPWVSSYSPPDSESIAWDFDVVNLDYYGLFLPTSTPTIPFAKRRAAALRKLFDRDRQDGWKDWLLLMTVASQVQRNAQAELVGYLEGLRPDSSHGVVEALDFLLDGTVPEPLRSARLVHGVVSALVSAGASNANLQVEPCGTVLYKGYNDAPMLHLAFLFRPAKGVLAPQVGRLALLQAPILRAISPCQPPWFELVPDQAPGLDEQAIRSCLSSMTKDVVDTIVQQRASA